jgi:hypothetical protein
VGAAELLLEVLYDGRRCQLEPTIFLSEDCLIVIFYRVVLERVVLAVCLSTFILLKVKILRVPSS